MHELAVCQALMKQLEKNAATYDAGMIERVVLSIGPLSGVEPQLLQRAFEISRTGTVAASAQLEIHTAHIRVKCNTCSAESEAFANRLLCAACGDWRVKVIAGEELILLSLEFCTVANKQPPGSHHRQVRSNTTNHLKD